MPWAKAGVGAVATQSFAELDDGIKGIELMENGATAEQAMRIILQNDEGRQQRQVGIVEYMGWENYDLRIPPVQNVDVAAGETLYIDRQVLTEIRKVFSEGRWEPRQR